LVATCESVIIQVHLKITPLTKATYFWPLMANYNMRVVPAELRVGEARILVGKALDLHTAAFKWFTLIQDIPTPEEVADWNNYETILKEKYAAAHHLACCPASVVAGLKRIVQDFNDLYVAGSGLNELDKAQKAGKTLRWGMYGGEGNPPYGPMQISWDWKELIQEPAPKIKKSDKAISHVASGNLKDKQVIMITTKQVTAGDIVLYRGNSEISKLIRFFDDAECNHASICVAKGQVGEATATGLKKNNIESSIKGNEYVVVRRLQSVPDTMQPVIKKADKYLAIGNPYAYDQIVLLAFLGLMRKIPDNVYEKWLLRRILDQAANWLLPQDDKQPMICSEFVYRCYNEALPPAHDIYSLEIDPFPGLKRASAAAKMTASKAQLKNVHPESLLAWAVNVSPAMAAAQTKKQVVAGPERFAGMSMDDLIDSYLNEAHKTIKRPLGIVDSSKSPDMLNSIMNFSRALWGAQGAPKSRAKKASFSLAGATINKEALDFLCKTVANFVTPGDLDRCKTLKYAGIITPKI
jgi:hypothetical protein